MPQLWERALERWASAGLVDLATVDRIRSFETERRTGSALGWPSRLALALGALLVGAGVLLFVSANWDDMSPAQRMGLVLLMVGGFHALGVAFAARFEALSTTLHALGTVALGAGVFLAGQIFNLSEHWPSGVLLWASGAWIAWLLLGDWPQLGMAAILTPAWLVSELSVADRLLLTALDEERIVSCGLFLLALAYFTVSSPRCSRATRQVLDRIGGFALLPCAVFLGAVPLSFHYWGAPGTAAHSSLFAVAWSVALLLPLASAALLRGRAMWWNALATLWALALIGLSGHDLVAHAWLAAGAIGFAIWGMRERRVALVNMSVAGFALVVFSFYVTSMMSKIGRSAALVGLGILFLAGGWALEQTRRRLVAQARGGAR